MQKTLGPEDQKRLERLAKLLVHGANEPVLLKAIDANLGFWEGGLELKQNAARCRKA